MVRYYVTGFSRRFGSWIAETVECDTRVDAVERFRMRHPTLRRLTAYKLG